MTKRSYEKRIEVASHQHGGERRGCGRPVRAELHWAKAGPRSLNITVHVGDERRHAVHLEVDASVLLEAAQDIQERAGVGVTTMVQQPYAVIGAPQVAASSGPPESTGTAGRWC